MNRQLQSKKQAAFRRLERRNAIKNIDYDATSWPSTSFEDQSSPRRARSLDVPALHSLGRTSFRVEGVDGEFDLICRSLGLSGPEDFAIPAAAWEARKSRSPFGRSPLFEPRDHHEKLYTGAGKAKPRASALHNLENECPTLKKGLCATEIAARNDCFDQVTHYEDESCKFGNQQNLDSVMDSCRDNASDTIEATIGVKEENRQENESSVIKDSFSQAKLEVRARRSDEVRVCDEESCQLRTGGNRISMRPSRNSGIGIKGARPPVLAPPPAASSFIADNTSSTWDLLWSFGPPSDEDASSGLVSSLLEKEKTIEDNGEVSRRIVGGREVDGEWFRDRIVISESCSDTSDDKDDDLVSMAVEPLHPVSPLVECNSTIKSWQKGDFLGSGSFGTVYEGFTEGGDFFAVKEVSLLDQGDQGNQSIFQLEQEIFFLSQFQHENIVQYLGTDKDNGKLYIFLELVTKGSLASLYQKYNLQDSQVSAYTRQILNGLNYLHLRKVVHRDIKCANILVDASGSVKLADFGLAKATNLNDVKSCKGTAFWMAPEVVNRKNQGYGLAADIWSLGCTVLEMLTRKIPYSHLEGMQALFRIGRGQPPLIPKSLSSVARDFISMCLQVSPDDRPTAAQLLDHPFVKGPQIFSAPASPFHHGRRFLKL